MAQDTIKIKDGDGVAKEILATLSPEGYSTITTGVELVQAVSMGLVEGYLTIDKFGAIDSIATNNGSDISQVCTHNGQSGKIVYDAPNSATCQYMSASDVLDVGQSIEITGLDINGNLVTQTAITNGESNVVLGTPLWRFFTAENQSDEGNDIRELLYFHGDPSPTDGVPVGVSMRGVITGDENRTLHGSYTIPLGYVGFLLRGELGVQAEGNAAALAENALCRYRSRRVGKVFTTKKRVTCMVGGGSAIYQDQRSVPDVIPALVDLKLEAKNVTAALGMIGTFDLLLVPEEKIPSYWLTAIGQPTVMPT